MQDELQQVPTDGRSLPVTRAISRHSIQEAPLATLDASTDVKQIELELELEDKEGAATPLEVEADEDASGKPEFQLADQTLLLPPRQLLIVLFAASSCVFLSFLDQTIVSTSLPTITSYFAAGRESTWVATSYLVASTASQPLYGRFSDIFGRKVLMLIAVAMFAVFSLACAVARTMLQLILFRAFQGFFGGGLFTMVMIITADLIALKDRGKYAGITEMVIAVANGIGPVLGGVISQKSSWRIIFWLNLPLCGAAMALLVVFLPSRPVTGSTREKLQAVDYGGSVTSLAATVLLLIGITWGGVTYPWISAQVLTPLILSVVLASVFVFWEGKVAKHPIMPLSVFRNKTSAACLSGAFFLGSSYYILLFYIPNFLQVVLGYSAITSSLLLLPYVVTVTVFVQASGMIISKLDRCREFLYVGFAIWAAGAGSLATLNSTASTAKIVGLVLVNGLGAGLVVQSTIIALMASVTERKELAAALAVRNWFRLLGGSVFLAVGTTIINNALRAGIEGKIPDATLHAILDDPASIQHTYRALLDSTTYNLIIDAYVRAFRILFLVIMGLLLLSCLISLIFVRHYSLKRDDDKALKEEGKRYVQEKRDKKKAAKSGAPVGQVQAEEV